MSAETPDTTGLREGLTIPAHHLVGLDFAFKCTNCGGHTSVTPPCIPARTYLHPTPDATPDPAGVTPEDVRPHHWINHHGHDIAALIERARAEGKAEADAAWAAKVEGYTEALAADNIVTPESRYTRDVIVGELRALIPADSTALDEVRAQAKAERDRLAAAVELVVEWRVTYYHEDERTGQNTFNTDAATDAARALAAYMEDCHDGRLAALHCRINGGEWMAVMPSVVVNRTALSDAGRGK